MTTLIAPAVPVWWPQILTAVLEKRRFVRMLLGVATPTVADGTLHLTFHRAGAAEHFAKPESGCMAVLRTALDEHGIDMPVAVHQA
ncbi:hypothetical protein [Streptomyces sp. KL116D]|uniref:hypothetical protein n=1 Tax=Streptomyces sp. KL116D TaxID=3045152 RepID=UPI0035565B16